MTHPWNAFRPAPMEGHGAYNRSSEVQAAGLSPAVPLLERAAHAISLPQAPAPIVIADYGASEGRNSLAPIAVAIACLRNRVGPNRAISVVHTDLPSNDFGALFETLESDPKSYLAGQPATFASAVGRSFYQQILPSGSVTLGWSSWAVQWLSRTPAPIPDQVQVAYSNDPAARAAYHRQAAEDWRTFLVHRGAELRPGGRLVVLTMALDDHGDFGYRPVVEAMHGALTGLVEQRFISADEAERMVIPTVARSRADLLAPFAADGQCAGLSVEHVEVFLGHDEIWSAFERDRDAAAFGARWAAFNRASVFPTLALGLDGGRDDPRAGTFFDRMEKAVTTLLAAAPQPTIMPLATIVLVKAEG
jgi:hypothetical protein